MRIRHIYPTASCRHETDEPVGFCIGSARNWFGLSSTRQSRYEGWFTEDTRTVPHSYYKLLERVTYVKGDTHDIPVEPMGVTVTSTHAFWEYGDGSRIGFGAHATLPALRIQSAREASLVLTLDIRGIYQHPGLGRSYQIRQVPGGVFIQYEDGLLGHPMYLALKTDGELCLDPRWQEVSYPWDNARHSPPDRLHVYELGVCSSTWIALGAGRTAEAAQQACTAAAATPFTLVGIGIAHAPDSLTEAVRAAQYGAEQTLALLSHQNGLYAGLPWFHQVWARDELIAALGLSPARQWEVIQKYLATPLAGGELPTFVGSGTVSADGVGWLALLIREYGLSKLGDGERAELRRFLETAVEGLKGQHRSPEGLITSGHNATWMDTIGRAGCRIEIQAMYGLVLELLADLGHAAAGAERADHLKRVKAAFLDHGMLKDGHDDPVIRPNCFLAYLLQPDLLTATEWERVFGNALKALRTDWGGLASLDQKHPDFQEESTGQDNRSYHQGDSWFFVNNLAGVALARFGMRQFRSVVQELLASSTEEILWKHTVGHAGEIASAGSGTSWGCGVQAFAAGPYLFFTRELGY